MSPLAPSVDNGRELQNIASSRSMPHALVQPAQRVLACGAGETNTTTAKRIGVTGKTVGKWRKRYREFGIEGLHDDLHPGCPRTYEDDKVAGVINRVLQTKPSDGSTQWNIRSLAAETGISKSTVHRWLKIVCLQPHRQKTFKISTDPLLVENVRDIVGLYLNHPEKAVVLCVDEKTQVQALDRTQPLLP
jgi:putative transposase